MKSTRRWSGTKFYDREYILKLSKNKKNGYVYVNINKNSKSYNKRVHILVAKAFIPNPNNYKQINHIDGNISNNSLDNLEWCTYGHNEKEAYRLGLKKPRLESKPILQIDKNTGDVIKRWNNSYEPRILGYSASNINMCCNGKRKSANGYVWRFANE